MAARPGSHAFLPFVLLVLVAAAAIALFACGKPAPFVVGGLVSETGAAERYGQLAREGMDFAVEEINANGGLPNGRRLKIEYRDDGSSPDKARAAVAELIKQVRVTAIIGGITSSIAEGVLPQVIDKEVVLLSPTASSAHLSGSGGGWFFRDYPSDTAEVQSMASLARKLDQETAIVLAQRESFGQSLAETFTQAFQNGGGTVGARLDFDLPLAPDQAAELAKKVVLAKPGVVYLAGYEAEVAALVRALADAHFTGVKLASSAVSPQIIRLSGVAAERLAFPQSAVSLETDDPVVKTFVDAFTKRYGHAPSRWAAYGYDAVNVLAEAIGKTRYGTADEIRTLLARADFRGVTGPIRFDDRGDIRREPHLYAVVNGQMVHFEDSDKDLRGMLIQ